MNEERLIIIQMLIDSLHIVIGNFIFDREFQRIWCHTQAIFFVFDPLLAHRASLSKGVEII